MDKFDQQIIVLLSEDARQSNAEIARKIGLSRTAVTSRIQKLENQGSILGYRAEIGSQHVCAAAYFHIQHSHGSCDDLTDEISSIPQVRQCHSISGDIDMIIFAQAESMASLELVRCRLAELPRVTKITTKAVLKELITR